MMNGLLVTFAGQAAELDPGASPDFFMAGLSPPP